MKHIAAIFFFLTSPSTTAQSVLPGKLTLFYNAQIVDVEQGSLMTETAILVEGARIKKLGSFNELKKDVEKSDQIDCKGKYVIPGLWDMHLHLEGADLVEDNELLLPVFLAYGITTVRDCASDLGEQVLKWRNEIRSGSRVGPTIYTAGRKLEGKNSIWKGDLEIENEQELTKMLDLLDNYKVDFVKITENTLNGELFLKSVRAAHDRGYRVSGHVPFNVSIQELVDAGYTSVEHVSYLLRMGSGDSTIQAELRLGKITRVEADIRYALFDQALAVKGYEKLARAGLFVCPTYIGLRQLAYLRETDHAKDDFLSYLTNRFVANYQWRIQRMGVQTPEQWQKRKDNLTRQMSQLPLMYKAGLRIIAGSDAAALNTYVYPAESLLQELEIFQQSGLTPSEILKTATINGAHYFGIADKAGSIAPGKNADLVLLGENPLSKISAVRSVQGVMAQGRYYHRGALDEMLKGAREKKATLDRSR